MERNTKKALNNIENNHNHSLWQEIYERNKNNLNSVALEYRSRKITYGELFNNTEIFASYLCELGFTEGSRVLVSASKTPEFIYLLLASSKLGLIVNPIDRRLGEDNLKDIINKSDNKTIFMSDDKYEELGTLIESSTLENVVLFSLSDSLGMEDGKKFDPFDAIDRKYKKFDDKKEEIKSKSTKKVQSVNMHPENISTPVNVTLDDAFTITYTLDRDGKVKEITNDVRNYMTSIIFRELEMKDITKKGASVLSIDQTYTRVSIENILETLYLGGKVTCEPIIDRDFFIYSLIINRPQVVYAPVDYWINMAEELYTNINFRSIDMPYVKVPVITSKVSPGEVAFLDRVFKARKIGKNTLLGLKNAFHVNTGYNETGRIFTGNIGKNGLEFTTLSCAHIDFIDRYGQSAYVREFGELEVESNTNSERVVRLPEYGTIEENENYLLKGDSSNKIKIESGRTYPLFTMKDAIEQDTENILSSEIVIKNGSDAIIIYIKTNPLIKVSEEDIVLSVIDRIKARFPKEVLKYVEIVIANRYPLNSLGERDCILLKRGEGSITKSFGMKEEKILKIEPKK